MGGQPLGFEFEQMLHSSSFFVITKTLLGLFWARGPALGKAILAQSILSETLCIRILSYSDTVSLNRPIWKMGKNHLALPNRLECI